MKELGFGPFRLDSVRRVVTDSKGHAVPSLKGLKFDIIELLVENAGKVVERDTFRQRIWGQESVGETTLATHIYSIRRALEAAHPSARNYIQSVQGKGYRFCEAVTEYDEHVEIRALPATVLDGKQSSETSKAGEMPTTTEIDQEAALDNWPNLRSATTQQANGTLRIWKGLLRRPQILVGGLFFLIAFSTVLGLLRGHDLEVHSIRRLTFDGEAKVGPLVYDGRHVYFRLDSAQDQTSRSLDLSDLSVQIVPYTGNELQIDDYCNPQTALLVYDGTNRTLSLFKLPDPVPRRLLAMRDLGSGSTSHDCQYLAYGGNNYIGVTRIEKPGTIGARRSRKKFRLPGVAIYPRWRFDDGVVRFCVADPVTTRHTLWQLRPRSGEQPRPVKNSPDGICDGTWTREGVYVAANKSQRPFGGLWLYQDLFFRGTVAREIEGGAVSWRSPVSDPLSSRIFAIGRSSKFELSELEPQTGAIKAFLGGISATDLEFSPDGKRIVFAKYPEWQIWIANADGSHSKQITGDFGEAHMPQFSPDGQRIAFMGKHNGVYRIFVANIQTAQAALVFDSGPDQSAPTWLSNRGLIFGDILLHDERAPQMSIHILDLITKPPHVADLPNSRGFYTPRMSPDCKRLIALSYDLKSIAEYNFVSKHWRVIGQARAMENPAWATPDSAYVYAIDGSGQRAVFRANVAPSEYGLSEIVQLDASHVIPGPSFTTTPDGRIVFLHRIAIDDIYELTYSMR